MLNEPVSAYKPADKEPGKIKFKFVVGFPFILPREKLLLGRLGQGSIFYHQHIAAVAIFDWINEVKALVDFGF